ncbi:MAG: hypothetical protein ACFFEY_19895 [Candidatus Thorarchaeota archaeon]
MERIFNVNLKANENIIIAKKEKLVALELKRLAKNLLKKAKTRKAFVEKEIKLAQVRKKLVENNKKVLENKIKSKELLKFPDDDIRNENNFINYHEKAAENQLELAKHHKEIARLEEKLARSKIDVANSKRNAANLRIQLGKLQLKYFITIQKKSHEKATLIRGSYKQKKEVLDNQLRDLNEKEKEVKIIQKDIADLTSKLSHLMIA